MQVELRTVSHTTLARVDVHWTLKILGSVSIECVRFFSILPAAPRTFL